MTSSFVTLGYIVEPNIGLYRLRTPLLHDLSIEDHPLIFHLFLFCHQILPPENRPFLRDLTPIVWYFSVILLTGRSLHLWGFMALVRHFDFRVPSHLQPTPSPPWSLPLCVVNYDQIITSPQSIMAKKQTNVINWDWYNFAKRKYRAS